MLSIKVARAAGFDSDRLRDLLSRSAERIAAGEPPREPTRPDGRRTIEQPLAFARIHHYLSMATPLLWTRQTDTIGVLGLALNACAERDGFQEERERIAELVACAKELWPTAAEAGSDAERIAISRATFKLIHLADVEAVTACV